MDRRDLVTGWLVLATALAGCTSIGDPGESYIDAGPPPRVKRPPHSRDGSASTPSCNGITEQGSCVDGTATYCDVERDALRRVDCQALGNTCVLDPVRGARCEAPAPGAGGGPGCGDVDDVGYCDGDVAVWCSPDEPDTLVRWDCAAEAKRCVMDDCTYGAYCCGEDPGPAQECPADLDLAGSCDGPANNTAVWCDNGVVFEIDCSESGQRCELDTCAYGAYCCGTSTASDECAALGWRGACDGDVARWCAGENIVEHDCSMDGLVCDVDGCGPGAYCCEPASASPECDALGWDGECVGDQLRYCDGTEIIEIDCGMSGLACRVDDCSPGEANCCERETTDCSELGWEGECVGDVVRYCNGTGEIIEIACPETGTSCAFDACWPGAAACCG